MHSRKRTPHHDVDPSDSSESENVDKHWPFKAEMSTVKKATKSRKNAKPSGSYSAIKDFTTSLNGTAQYGSVRKDYTGRSFYDVGKFSVSKLSKSPTKVHDIGNYNSFKVRQQLEDDHRMKVKMNSIQKSLSSQEKVLRDVHRKMVNEKSELSVIKNKLGIRPQIEIKYNERSKSRSRTRSPLVLDEAEEKGYTASKKASILKEGGKTKGYSYKQNLTDSTDNEMEKDPYRAQVRYYSEKALSGRGRDKKDEFLEEELERKGEENVFQRKKLNEMKTTVKEVSRKYEREIEELKAQIHDLNEQNFEMKARAVPQKDYEQIEHLYEKRIKELEDTVAQKDREIAEKEGYYEGQIEDISSKVEELQHEVRKMGEYEDQVKDLTEQLELKDKELEMIKKYYIEKIQTRIDEHAKAKKEWTQVYHEMIHEMRNLKGEVGSLGFENQMLTSCTSHSSGFRGGFDPTSSKRGYNFL